MKTAIDVACGSISLRRSTEQRSSANAACVICRRIVRSSFIVRGYRLFECSACNFVFIDPEDGVLFRSELMFDDGYFSGGGAGYTNYFDEASLLEAHGRRYGTLLQSVGAHNVLDAGAAAGFVLHGMQQSGCVGMGIEPNASMVSFAARTLGLNICQSTLETFEHDGRFDAVSLLQVVDHLENPRRAFERVRALTKPGGWCLIEFGDRASVIAQLLGPAWHEYAPPSVQRVFSLGALARLLSDYGFTLRKSGHPKKYLRADHALSLLRYKSPPWAENFLARFAGLVPPEATLRYIGDDITWALFQRDERDERAAYTTSLRAARL